MRILFIGSVCNIALGYQPKSFEHRNGRRPNLTDTGNRWLTFGWWSGSARGFRITFSFFTTEKYAIFLQLLAFLCFLNSHAINSRFVPQALGEITDADEIMHPQFGTDTTDILIQINPKVRIRFPDHLSFKLWRWRRFALFITDRTSLISKIQNVWSHRFSKCRRYIPICSIENGISNICYLEVSFWAFTTVVIVPWKFLTLITRSRRGRLNIVHCISLTDCPPNSTLQCRWSSLPGRRCSYLEESTTARHFCAFSSRHYISAEDPLHLCFLSRTVLNLHAVPVKWLRRRY